jgi:3-dehydroquinate synthetase
MPDMSDFDYLADVRRYASGAKEEHVAAIKRHLGIALRSLDASLVSGSDPEEMARVREKWLKKKLALTESDDKLDAAVKKVVETMKDDRQKRRVTVYYLLAAHFGKLSMFDPKKK